jgi:hypothetical protein
MGGVHGKENQEIQSVGVWPCHTIAETRTLDRQHGVLVNHG